MVWLIHFACLPTGKRSKIDMEFFEAVQRRQSIRKFRDAPVPAELLTRVLEATAQAPSAGNLQAYRIFIVQQPAVRQRLARAAGNQACVAEAPFVLVFCTDPSRSAAVWGTKGEQLLCVQDATVACAYAQLAATALGLASIWLGATIESEAIKTALGLTEDLWPIVLLPLGYAAEQPTRKPRRPLQDLVQQT